MIDELRISKNNLSKPILLLTGICMIPSSYRLTKLTISQCFKNYDIFYIDLCMNGVIYFR